MCVHIEHSLLKLFPLSNLYQTHTNGKDSAESAESAEFWDFLILKNIFSKSFFKVHSILKSPKIQHFQHFQHHPYR
jgi:hypothetical protein